ncbi:MAG: HrcA family transcriptional regulator [Bacilli bacterium]|jgi:heat-inducible transcriptional repressor|nr:HrcA family transcriptional regulator [Bacilli bacterium]
MLSERQRMILNAIVDDYIRYAEPIGSRSISKRGDVGFSPATIRNEMSDLEELGFLEQPHTSAGRIPSNKGYRYYVDHLVQYGALSTHELGVMKGFFAEKINEVEQAVQQVATILSGLTNYTSIVLGPEVFNTTLKHLQIVPLDERTAVAIIVTSTGHVENKTFTLPEGIPMAEVEKITAILNAKLVNVPIVQLRSKLYNEIGSELSKYVDRYEELLHVVEDVLKADEQDRIFLGGATNMLTQPEFKDVDKVKHILDMLDEKPNLMRMFTSMPEGIQVRIGTENSVEAINNCSLITASYSIEGQFLGTIGILGPTRMEYGKVIRLLDYLSRDMSLILGRWYK